MTSSVHAANRANDHRGALRRPGALDGRVRVRAASAGAVSLGALAVGALAIGAVAIGAMAIGRLAVGRALVGGLDLRRARIGRLEIDELVVRRSAGMDAAFVLRTGDVA